MKCKYNPKLKKRICKREFFSRSSDGVTQPNKNVRYLAIITAFILSFIAVINIGDSDTVRPLIISLIFLGGGITIYSLREYQDDVMGWVIRETPLNLIWALMFSVSFILISSIVPFFTLAFPRYPNAIGQDLKFFLIVIIAPISESIFFQSGIFAFLRNFSKNNKYFFIILTSVIFSLFHLGAYLLGIYNLDVGQVASAFTSNLSAFVTAFVFSLTVMIFALRNGVEKANLMFIILAHVGLNFASYSLSVIRFV